MAQEFIGKSVAEAIEEGLKELGLKEEQAVITVLEEGTKGKLFGIGAKLSRVSIQKKVSDAERAAQFLEGVFDILKIRATTEITEDSEERIVINLITTDSSALIGYRGEVLDSLQCIAGAIANKNKEQYIRVVVDCEGYRDKREVTLKGLAEKLAQKAIKTGRKLTLEPMNPYERRIIHSSLVDNEHVKTLSEGKEPNRYIAIIPDNYDPSKDRKPFNKNRNGQNRNGNGKFSDRGGYKGNRNNGDRKFNKDGHGSGNGYSRNGGGNNKFSSPRPKTNRTGFGGGVFLGNSLKNGSDTTNKD